jgi:hypothetical protein
MPMSPRLLRPILSGDPDALRYIAAVQRADGNTLEPAVRKAITDFVVGCKADGIWSAIKASCILMGARTLSGALTPLVGAAPTNNGPFVSGDYNRKTGLLGNGVGKYLDSNRNNNADPQDNNHNAVYASATGTGPILALLDAPGTGNSILATLVIRNRTSTTTNWTAVAGTLGHSRAASGSFSYRNGGSTLTASISSDAPQNASVTPFRSGAAYGTWRLAFYSIGEALGLALLDTRVSDLYTAIGAAIP